MTTFIAIDGEADSQGNYIILCDSQGRVLYNPNGITTTEAFDFLLSLPRKCELVCFGLNYDANQWLKDIPKATLQRLATDNRCAWKGEYKLEWIPSKTFTVTVPGKSVTICEVFGFFQTSFVKALTDWGFDPPTEIETMKRKRGTFTRKELQRVVRYCQTECKLLVALMKRLADACREAECVPYRRWIGAGSIASSLLSSHQARQHHAYDLDLFGLEGTDHYVLRAYFGGRVELYQQGWKTRAITSDIRSAYPYAAMQLPSLTEAEVTYSDKYVPFLHSLWRVSWSMPQRATQIGPFPVRLSKGEICYPLQGEGVYHQIEIQTAIDLGYPVQVHEGYILRHNGSQPLEWISDVYAHRARFKAEGNRAEKALKLGLNSVYGKMAQGYGFGRRPPFQSYYWAGFITAFTRARVLKQLANSHTPIMVATDGIVADRTPMVQRIKQPIGSWEQTRYDKIATVQPGVYTAVVNGETLVKSRGFFARDVDYMEMLDSFYNDPSSCYHFTSRRFIGLKVALHRKDFGVWRQWINERRSIAFEIKNKEREVNLDGTVTLFPISGPFSSLPYVPKQSLYDDPSDGELENLVRDDQPHREVD